MRRLFFTLYYWFTRPPWDTHLTPPELVELVETQKLRPGRALDLGCGTGTNVIYLAKHGWEATGVDFVGKAIAAARRKALAAGVQARFFQGDVTRLDFLDPPFNLALDLGCLHSLPAADRPAYIAGLARLLSPGAIFLCYAFKPESPMSGIAVEAMLQLFGAAFENVKVEHGTGRPSAWYTFRRRHDAETPVRHI
jgi:ubiquinone/menaquinone biosynthesis C-methylase UbiE